MKIVAVSHTWDDGGSGLYASALVHGLRARGHDVRTVGPGRARGLSTEDPVSEAALRAALPADVVHIHHLSGSSWRLPALAKAAGARVVMTLHDAFTVCARGQLVDHALRRCAGPTLDGCVRCLAPDLWAPLPPALATRMWGRTGPVAARRAAEAQMMAAVDVVLTPSRRFAERLGIRARTVPLPLLAPVAVAPMRAPGPVALLFLGAMIPTKGPDLLVEAFAGLPAGAATLRLVGPTPAWRGSSAFVDRLRARVAGLPGARMEGAVARGGMDTVRAAADVLCFPSTWEENAPLVVQEARAAGLRVVASDLEAMAEQAPEAVRVAPEVEAWRAALAAQVRVGQARVVPVPGIPLTAHLDVIEAVYRGG